MSISQGTVRDQVNRMIAFLHQEASEKVEEIEIRAEEEFIVERTKILQRERDISAEIYLKKQKEIELAKKRSVCSISNENRLIRLKAKEELLGRLRDEVYQSVSKISTCCPDQYKQFLGHYIDQALGKLKLPAPLAAAMKNSSQQNGNDIVIRGREQDYEIIKSIVKDRVRVDDQNFLDKRSAGGIIASSMNGKIEVDNTLESRLQLAFAKATPKLRTIMFGPNPHRKFFN